jgi:hypothetical protein
VSLTFPTQTKVKFAHSIPMPSKKTAKILRKHSRPITPREFDRVRQIAHTLEGVEDGMSYGTAALKVHGALFIRLREDDDTLVLRCPIEDRDALIESDPDTYFLTDHYVNYPWVLARLSTINPAILRDVVAMAHRNALADKKSKPKRSTRR